MRLRSLCGGAEKPSPVWTEQTCMKTNGRNSARYGPWVILLAGGSEWETQDLRMNLEPKGMWERERERDAGVRGCAWQLGQNWHHLRAEISSGERCARVLKTAVKLLWFGLLISTVSSSVTQLMEALKVTLKLPLVPDCQFFALHLQILP